MPFDINVDLTGIYADVLITATDSTVTGSSLLDVIETSIVSLELPRTSISLQKEKFSITYPVVV